jgi:signal transduction histidine kinase
VRRPGAAPRERWLEAAAEVTGVLLSGRPGEDVPALVAERAAGLTSAVLAVAAVPTADGTGLFVQSALGPRPAVHRGQVLPVHGTLAGAAFLSGAPVTSDDIAHDSRVPHDPVRLAGLGPALAVPVGDGARIRGAVLLARQPGGRRFVPREAALSAEFAGRATDAWGLADGRANAEQARLRGARDRTARDLHDLVLQRLYATGLALQRAEHRPEGLRRAAGELDETITEVRSVIAGLRSRTAAACPGLRTRAVRAADEAAGALGFAPGVRTAGPLDSRVPRDVADHAVAVLSEALSNVARHARATRADVLLETDGHEVRLTVTDDGQGLAHGGAPARAAGTGGGLRNLAERAADLGGALEVTSPPAGGTTLTWHVPLHGTLA